MDAIIRFSLNEELPELLENVPLADIRGMWLYHDGAPAHFAISKSLDWPWQPHRIATKVS